MTDTSVPSEVKRGYHILIATSNLQVHETSDYSKNRWDFLAQPELALWPLTLACSKNASRITAPPAHINSHKTNSVLDAIVTAFGSTICKNSCHAQQFENQDSLAREDRKSMDPPSPMAPWGTARGQDMSVPEYPEC